MAQSNTLMTLNGLFKEVYANKLERLIPDGVKLYKMIPFVPKEKQIGNRYNQPVILGAEHGITYGGPDDDAFNLEPAVAGQIKNAQVPGNPRVMRSNLGYTSASRSKNSAGAFEEATKYLVANMLQSMHKRLEIETLYGQMGLASVSVVDVDNVTISPASWAAGIWAGSEKMPIEIRSAAGALRGNANVTRVDMDTRQVFLDAVPAGVVATDVPYFKTAYGNEFPGIAKIITNTGTLFGIDAAQYSLWKGNTVVTSGDISLEKLELAISRPIEKGLDNDVVCLLNPRIFSVLVSDEAALRKYDHSYDSQKAENGFRSLKFFASSGAIEVMPSIYIKQGDCFLLNLKDFVRIGSSDITFKRPGAEGEFFRDVENAAAYEMRAWCDVAIFTPTPGKNVLIQGYNIPS